VALHGTEVAEPQILEQESRNGDSLEGLLAPFRCLGEPFADAFQGDCLDGAFDAGPPAMVVLPGDDLVQVALERTHVGVDAHVVVVQDHQEVLGAQVARLVEALEGHARGHGAIPDDGDAGEILLLQVPGHGHAQGGGDARAGMTGPEMVVDALVPFLEA